MPTRRATLPSKFTTPPDLCLQRPLPDREAPAILQARIPPAPAALRARFPLELPVVRGDDGRRLERAAG